MRLTLALSSSFTVEFTELGDTVGPYPFLKKVGPLRWSARAGHITGIGVGESPSLVVSLDNEKKQASTLIGRPLRVRADVFDDNNAAYFSGFVSDVAYGRSVDLTIEA